jgi:hypothetical protein
VKVEEILRAGNVESNSSRTLNLGRPQTSVKGTTEARFYVSLMPGPAGLAQVADIKFISGDDKLKPIASLLKNGKFGLVFPGERATKVIRRGTLSCHAANGECTFIMITPDSVTSIE